MKRQATAEWKGVLRTGTGTLSTPSKALASTPYSFRSRFGEGVETNPEELLAAAHAGCFSMALSAQLGSAGFEPEWIRTQAIVDLDQLESGWTITRIHLTVRAKVPKADLNAFDRAAEAARGGCIVSRVLKANITMDAALET
jgi:osmotically inducible protein OsmC